jgi:hypothetical protein
MLDVMPIHLPSGSYWVCNSKYNGLSQIAKAKPLSARICDAREHIGVLKNRKISSTILKQLAHA